MDMKGCDKMKIFRNGLIAGILVLSLGLAGCSSLGGEKFVAKVNGQAITEADFNSRIANVQKSYEAQGMKFDTDEGKKALEQVKSQVLEGMIASKLVMQEAKKLNLNVDDPKVKEQVDQIKQMVGDDAQYQEWLKQQAMTEEEVKNYFALSTKVAEGVTVSDEQVKAFFDSHQEQYGGQPEQEKASHILVATEPEATDIIAQLQKGADFAQLAKDKSTDTGSKDSGGDLGYFSKGQMVPEFEKAAFSQAVGTYTTTPVKTEFGYHIIKVVDHKQGTQADFAKMKDQVSKDAFADAKAQKFETYYSDLRTKAEPNIEYAKEYKPAAQPAG
jgi:peptidyl-prolyl cis-trans isomerase C